MNLDRPKEPHAEAWGYAHCSFHERIAEQPAADAVRQCTLAAEPAKARSPRLQPGVLVANKKMGREYGPSELSMVLIFKQISPFEIDLMPFEEIDVLLLKCNLAMMLFLIPDVVLHRIGIRITHRKSAVPFLPLEMLLRQPFGIHPGRRTSFDLSDHVAD